MQQQRLRPAATVYYVIGGELPFVPGSVRAQCADCGAAIYLSPASIDQPGRRVCQRCVPATATAAVITEGVLLDLAAHWGCSPDQAYDRCASMMRAQFDKPLLRRHA